MDLAVRTSASPAATWAIVVVAVVLLAFWLIMVMVYATRPDPRHRRLAGLPGPAQRRATAAAEAPAGSIPAQRAAPADAKPAATAVGGSPPAGTASPGAGGRHRRHRGSGESGAPVV